MPDWQAYLTSRQPPQETVSRALWNLTGLTWQEHKGVFGTEYFPTTTIARAEMKLDLLEASYGTVTATNGQSAALRISAEEAARLAKEHGVANDNLGL